jgi:hypothetical protein
MACVAAVQDCAALDTSCPNEDAVRADLERQGATACGNGQLPQPPPAEWRCDPGYFNAADGCDCGCGAVDVDCGGVGCGELSCQADGCAWCHASDGSDVSCGGESAGEGEAEQPIVEPAPVVEPVPVVEPAPVVPDSCAWVPAPALVGLAFCLRRRRR